MRRVIACIVVVVAAGSTARAQPQCSELDRLTAMVLEVESACGFKATEAGRTIAKLATSLPCIAAARGEFRQQRDAMRSLVKDPGSSDRRWCDASLSTHVAQTAQIGMNPLFAAAR